jgi:alkane 1-monooxygenase
MVHSALPFAAAYLIPFTVLMGFIAGGPFTWATTLVVFGLIPLLDVLDGENTDNLSAIDEAKLKDSLPFKLITWGVAPVQIALVTFGAWVVATGQLSGWSLAGFVLGVGFSAGALGITVAHELVHQTDRFEKFLGNVILCAVSYTHWGVEHVYGHHRHVSTPHDPASSRFNESFYAFWPRTVFGTIRSSWNIEVARMARMKQPVLSPHNRILQGWAMTAAFAAALTVALGPVALGFFVVQSIVAFSLLEIINYVEHYGLERRKLEGEGDKYEAVTPWHSWNSSQELTNLFLFNLQRHSDHHARASRRYPILRHVDDAPQLPTGYAGMVLLALVPPVWFRVMNPRVEAWRARLAATQTQAE